MNLNLSRCISTFEMVTCVATLHHLPLKPALVGLNQLAAPDGHLIVISLAANKNLRDWMLPTLAVLSLYVVGVLRRESLDIGMVTCVSRESLAGIRRATVRLPPRTRTRRRFYYRYIFIWGRSTEGS